MQSTYQFQYDAVGDLTLVTLPMGATLTYVYDAGRRMTKVTNVRGETRAYTYDNEDNPLSLTTETASGTVTQTHSAMYDDWGRITQSIGAASQIWAPTQVTDGWGSSSFVYDAQGRVTSVAKVISGGGYATPFTVGYGYDANGKLTQITYPSGDIVNISRATDGQVTGVTQTPAGGAAQTIASGVTYEPFGPLTGFTYGNGLGLARTYDQDYRLTGISVAPTAGAATLGLGYSWQPDGRLLSVTDPAGTGRAASFGYTLSGRVTSGVGPWGTYAYLYDAAGNRTQSGTASAPVVATVATASNQITQTSQGGVTQRTFTYPKGGELTKDVHAGGITYGYTFNDAKQLITVKQNSVVQGSYAYDFRGARVWRETYGTGAAQIAYVYDESGHLLAEHNAVTGAVTREYVWIDDLPVALINISGATQTTNFIHTGQIDDPLAVTNSARALVWNAYVDPFGIATTFAAPSTTLDMRLPGQSFQLETNSLHQNHWRDYDPSLGRYIEPDPLGIDAGQNVYGYVDGDPLNLQDSYGLSVCIWIPFPIGIVPAAGGANIYLGSFYCLPSAQQENSSGAPLSNPSKPKGPTKDQCIE